MTEQPVSAGTSQPAAPELEQMPLNISSSPTTKSKQNLDWHRVWLALRIRNYILRREIKSMSAEVEALKPFLMLPEAGSLNYEYVYSGKKSSTGFGPYPYLRYVGGDGKCHKQYFPPSLLKRLTTRQMQALVDSFTNYRRSITYFDPDEPLPQLIGSNQEDFL